MERRSWPWRRKSAEKAARDFQFVASQPTITTTVVSSICEDPSHRDIGEQEMSKSSAENERVMDAVLKWQQAEEKVKILTEKLAAAMSDIAEKNEMVKQRSKVAEDAVVGWEKADSEALSLKQQLETTHQEKKAVEDHATHLDVALKECMKQVRLVREEQEQKIQEALLKKTQEWDKIRAELEAKHAELGRHVLESEAENSAMSKSLQERARTIVEVNEIKARSETEVKVLQVRVESLEKQISTLKYEIRVLNKELEIRTEEREYSKKAADAAHKQHLENVKKIARFESECQRLRTLVRKKLPGPAALAQMRMEVDGLGRDLWEGKKKRTISKGPHIHLESLQEFSQGNAQKEIEILTGRLLAMEEETNLLKEVLSKRNSELQAARQMCARTANKLSIVEEHLETLSQGQVTPRSLNNNPDSHNDALSYIGNEPSVTSRSEDDANDEETSCAESWASALITELAHFKKDNKVVLSSGQSIDSHKLDSADDTPEHQQELSPSVGEKGIEEGPIVGYDDEHGLAIQDLELSGNIDIIRNLEIHSMVQMCKVIISKLTSVEENLRALKLVDVDHEGTVARVQESLTWVTEANEEVSKFDKILCEVLTTIADSSRLVKHSTGATQVCVSQIVRDSSPEGISLGELEASTADAKEQSTISSSIHCFSFVMCKIVQLVESLAGVMAQHTESRTENPGTHSISQGVLCNDEPLLCGSPEKQIQSLNFLKEKVLHGKIDTMEFLLQIALVLSYLSGIDPSELESMFIKVSSSNNVAEEVEKLVVSNDLEADTSSSLEKGGNSQDMSEKFNLQQETQFKEPSSIHPSMESISIVNLQRELEQVKQEKAEVDSRLDAAEEELQHTKSELVEAKQLLSELQEELSLVQESRIQLEKGLADVTVSRTDLESRFKDAEIEAIQLQGKITSLTEELAEQRRQYEDTVVKCNELEQQLQEVKASTLGSSRAKEMVNLRRTTDANEARSRKEREMASAKEKLAECQRTILVLGKQLNAISHDSLDASFGSSVESGASPDNRSVSAIPSVELVSNDMEDVYLPTCIEMDRKKAYSGMLWSNKNDRRFVQGSSNNTGYISGLMDDDDDDVYTTVHRSQNGAVRYHGRQHYSRHIPLDFYRGNEKHSPIQEYTERQAFLYSPPDTAMSSPARSPARFVQFNNQQKRSTGTSVRANLTKSMNKAASNTPHVKQTKSGSSSSFSRLFSRNKHHS